MKKKGSALLIVIFVTTLLSFITFSIWYKSSLILDLVIAREQFYKNYYLTEAILDFGIDFTKNRFDGLLKEEGWPIKLDLGFLLSAISKNLNKTEQLQKDLYVQMLLNKDTKKKDSIQLFVNLYKNDISNALCSLGCRIKKKEILISEETFNVDEKRKQNKQQIQKTRTIFIIKNYTIGTTI